MVHSILSLRISTCTIEDAENFLLRVYEFQKIVKSACLHVHIIDQSLTVRSPLHRNAQTLSSLSMITASVPCLFVRIALADFPNDVVEEFWNFRARGKDALAWLAFGLT